MTLWIRLITMLAVAATAVLPMTASAQSWPQRNVRFILSLGPASGADITIRMLSDQLQKRWGQSVIIENRPGGDSIVSFTAVIGANDDHTLLFSPTASMATHPYTQKKVPYDLKELIPIARATLTVVTLTVPTAIGVNSVADLVALARKQPGKLNWAGVTGLNDFQFNAFTKTQNLNMVRVPYRDTIQAVNDLTENRIQAYYSAYGTVRALVQSGKIKIIALSNTQRFKALPDIPTVRQAGFPALEFDGLVGVFGTKAVPQQARQRIEKDFVEILSDPAMVERLTATGQIVLPGTAAEFAASIESQRQVAVETAKVLGLKAAAK